jgi:DNA polymerase III delta subunit
MGLKPYRAGKLAEQAARWELQELEAALRALLDVDLVSKGIALDGSSQAMSDERAALTLQAWIAESVVGDGADQARRRSR